MKRLQLALLSAIVLPIALNAKPASRYKVTCDDYPCTENELSALRLANENYGKKLENRLKNNTYYPYPWYWVYKKKVIVNIRLQSERICQLIWRQWNGLMLIFVKRPLN